MSQVTSVYQLTAGLLNSFQFEDDSPDQQSNRMELAYRLLSSRLGATTSNRPTLVWLQRLVLQKCSSEYLNVSHF